MALGMEFLSKRKRFNSVNTYWKDLVTKSDTLQDPYEWRYYETDEVDPEILNIVSICICPSLMFNF